MTVGLFQRKSNVSKLHDPLAYAVTFDNDRITVLPDDPKKVPEFANEMSLPSQILDMLKSEKRSLEVDEFSSTLGSSKDSIRRTLNRLKDKEQVIKVGKHGWGLTYQSPSEVYIK